MPGIIISGGIEHRDGPDSNTTEIWIPSTGLQCSLLPLPLHRHGHTHSGDLLCGGGLSTLSRCSAIFVNLIKITRTPHRSTCLERSWNVWRTLDLTITARVGHSAWSSRAGLVLLGGDTTGRSVEIINGTAVRKYFDLRHHTK